MKYRSEKISVEVSMAPLYGHRTTMALSTRIYSDYNNKSVTINKVLKEDKFNEKITDNMNMLTVIADTIAYNYKMLKVVRGVKGDIERKIILNTIKDYTQDEYWTIEPPAETVITSC